MKESKFCIECSKEFFNEKRHHNSPLRWENRKYCSILCRNKNGIGKPSWNKGVKGTGFGERPKDRKLGIRYREQNNMWKGDSAGYTAKHMWMYSQFGHPKKCEYCQGTRFVEWANISGEYKRERTDWLHLCKKCHVAYDDTINKGWETRKRGATL